MFSTFDGVFSAFHHNQYSGIDFGKGKAASVRLQANLIVAMVPSCSDAFQQRTGTDLPSPIRKSHEPANGTCVFARACIRKTPEIRSKRAELDEPLQNRIRYTVKVCTSEKTRDVKNKKQNKKYRSNPQQQCMELKNAGLSSSIISQQQAPQ